MSDLEQTVKESFIRYAGNVILDRAICDIRDMLKPSARMLMYSQIHITKNIPSKPFIKSARVVGDCLGHYYTHGDASCYSTYMRMAKPFAMRYPLEVCQGNVGTITQNGDEAAARYTELRLSPLGNYLFSDIDKNTINDWCDNFDETETYPKILPSKGFYNIVNGSIGIGISLSASIPQFNLREINNALIELLYNPNYEVDILPDFATGGILINPEEVKLSLKNGSGSACKLRSVIEYDQKERTLIVKEIPYGLYTNILSEEIAKLLESNPDCGIEKINDGSDKKPDYIIYLSKKANPDKVLKLLYKETSLQSHYTINMNVLVDEGRRPKLVGLREMLISHLTHEKQVYTRGFQYDLNKIKDRIHIIEALLKAYDAIDEVIQTIKTSASTAVANTALQKLLSIDEVQAKAILDLKLSRLSKLDITKLCDEQKSLEKERDRIESILSDENLLKKEIEKGLREVADKFGDERRTKIMNLSSTEDDEVIEEKQLSVSITNKNALFISETSTLFTQRRNTVGQKFKLDNGEFIIANQIGKNIDNLLVFSETGKYYSFSLKDFPINEKYFLNLPPNETICAGTIMSKGNTADSIVFLTKNGLIKKSLISNYNLSNHKGATALSLDSGDSIVSINFLKNEPIGILTSGGNFVIINTSELRNTGRVTKGITAIKLDSGDKVVSARVMPKTAKEIVSVSSDGYVKRSPASEFHITGRATKGIKLQKSTSMKDFYPLVNETELNVATSSAQLRTSLAEIPQLSRGAAGVKLMKLKNNDEIIKISAF